MAQHKRLRSGNSMKKVYMRPAIAMIELIFAMVIIAISVITIPTMVTVADQASKQILMDDDVVSRLSGWAMDKFQARWDGNYSASGSGPLVNTTTTELGCTRGGGTVWYRINPDSVVQCDVSGNPPSIIPNSGDGNLSRGVEQLNHGNSGNGETITITPDGGTAYNVTATYEVRYVTSALTNISDNTAEASWKLGSAGNMAPDGSLGTALNQRTHLKRVVIRFQDNGLDVDTALTFFKSNKGN